MNEHSQKVYNVMFYLGYPESFALLIALVVYLLGMLLSRLWVKYFRFGPVEWLWRMLTYGQYLPIRREKLPAETVV